MNIFSKKTGIVVTILFLISIASFGSLFVKSRNEELPKFQQSLKVLKEKQSGKKWKAKESLAVFQRIKKNLTYEVGGLIIPDVLLNMSINEGMDDHSITYGAGIDMPDNKIDTMGQGNFVLASHDYPQTFGKLINVTEGMLVYTTDLEMVYTFKVNEVFVANNDDVADIKRVREQTKGENKLTLYTCLGEQGTPLRTVVVAELLSTDPISQVSDEVLDLFEHE